MLILIFPFEILLDPKLLGPERIFFVIIGWLAELPQPKKSLLWTVCEFWEVSECSLRFLWLSLRSIIDEELPLGCWMSCSRLDLTVCWSKLLLSFRFKLLLLSVVWHRYCLLLSWRDLPTCPMGIRIADVYNMSLTTC